MSTRCACVNNVRKREREKERATKKIENLKI